MVIINSDDFYEDDIDIITFIEQYPKENVTMLKLDSGVLIDFAKIKNLLK